MARFKTDFGLKKDPSDLFDKLHQPGSFVPTSGIYRCTGCGREDACNQGDPFPTQNHHQHGLLNGLIQWQLFIATN